MSVYKEQLQEYMRSSLKGDARAYTELLRMISLLARRMIAHKVSRPDEIEDIVQEVLLAIHKAQKTFDPDRPVMPWVASIIHYKLNDWLRKHYSARTGLQVPIEDVLHFLTDDVTQTTNSDEFIEDIMPHLTEGQQNVIHAMYVRELSVSETAKALDMSDSAVKVTAHRAYQKLRKVLGS